MNVDVLLQLLVNVLEVIAFGIALYKFKLLYNSNLRLLFVVLAFIVITEVVGLMKLYVFEGIRQMDNFTYYNITTLIILLLYYVLYFDNLKVGRHRNVFLAACIITILFYIINIAFIQTGPTFHTYSFTIGSICLCLGIIFYVKEIVESEQIIFVSKQPLFWVSIGLFSFYIINIPYMGMYNYLVKDYIDFLVLCRKISLFLNYCMYSCIIIGLLCLKK